MHSETQAGELAALDSQAQELNNRVEKWESDYSTWKKQIAEAKAKAMAAKEKLESDKATKKEEAETQSAKSESDTGAPGEKTKRKKKNSKSKKKKSRKTAEEEQEMKKQKEFEEARARCVVDLQAMQDVMERLSELNSVNPLSDNIQSREGMVEKLRDEVASAHVADDASCINNE